MEEQDNNKLLERILTYVALIHNLNFLQNIHQVHQGK